MITAADYVDWAQYAGIYTGSHSHAERYRTYANKLSPEGLTVQIVYDFLNSQSGEIDVVQWRMYEMYELGNYARVRLALTADALDRVGATRLAAKVRVAEDNSALGKLLNANGDVESTLKEMQKLDSAEMMNQFRGVVGHALPTASGHRSAAVDPDREIESRVQVQALLDAFVLQQQATLVTDYEKFGDVRAEPGFDPQARLRELEQQHRAELQLEYQNEQASELAGILKELRDRITSGQRLGTLRKQALSIVRKWRGRPRLQSDLQDTLSAANVFFADHSALFFPPATDDERLQSRIASIGDCDVDPSGDSYELCWPAVAALHSKLGQISICTNFTKGDDQSLSRILSVVERKIDRWSSHIVAMEQSIQKHFRIYYSQMDGDEQAEYELNAQGQLTEAALNQHCRGGTLYVTIEDWAPDEIQSQLFMGVSWDDEHGFEWEF